MYVHICVYVCTCVCSRTYKRGDSSSFIMTLREPGVRVVLPLVDKRSTFRSQEVCD